MRPPVRETVRINYVSQQKLDDEWRHGFKWGCGCGTLIGAAVMALAFWLMWPPYAKYDVNAEKAFNKGE